MTRYRNLTPKQIREAQAAAAAKAIMDGFRAKKLRLLTTSGCQIKMAT
jgi:hypothetical protein